MPGFDDDDDARDESRDDAPAGPRPDPLDRPWVHPAELQSFVATPEVAASPPRPREWVIGVLSACAGIAATLLLLVAFGALGERNRSAIPPAVVTTPNSPIDYAVGQRVAESVGPSVVTVNTNAPSGNGTAAWGSGVVIKTDKVLTSAHLLNGATEVTVTTKFSDEPITATVLGIDPNTDLCLLAVRGAGPELAALDFSSELDVGKPVVAVGAGRGNLGWASMGIVQERNALVSTPALAVAGLVVTSTRTNRESTGGALLDVEARVVGILTSPPGAAQAGMAVPIQVALDVAAQLEDTGKAAHGALGVLYGPDESARAGGGAKLRAVVEGGAAAKAVPPLQAGDVITRAGDARIAGMVDLLAESRNRQPGDQLVLSIQRNGKQLHPTVTLEEAQPWVDTGYGTFG